MKKIIIFMAIIMPLTGCANTTRYQASDWYYGGYSDEAISDSIYKINYSGDNTDLLTIQTYWLYRATELTLEKGFDGFEILKPAQGATSGIDGHILLRCPDLMLICSGDSRTPWLNAHASIHLLRGSINTIPYRVFNARTLKTSLEPIVKGKYCGRTDPIFPTTIICPHDKSYLVPKLDNNI